VQISAVKILHVAIQNSVIFYWYLHNPAENVTVTPPGSQESPFQPS